MPPASGLQLAVVVSSRVLIVLALVVGCAGEAPPVVPDEPAQDAGSDAGGDDDGAPPDGGTPVRDPFDADELAALVSTLSTGDCADRSAASPGDKRAADLVADRFAALGLQTTRQPFTDGAGHATENVIARIATSANASSDTIVIGAHRDTLPASSAGKFPGANANASGTAALLALAEALSAEPAPRQIVLVSFGAGEGTVAAGAKFFVQQLPAAQLASIVFMIDLDMVGTYDAEQIVFALGAVTSPTGHAILELRGGDVFPLLVDLDSAGDGSDHVPFCAAGIPYTIFYTPDPDCYHKSCDTAERLDTASMSLIAQLAADFALDLATSTADLAGERVVNGCVDR